MDLQNHFEMLEFSANPDVLRLDLSLKIKDHSLIKYSIDPAFGAVILRNGFLQEVPNRFICEFKR